MTLCTKESTVNIDLIQLYNLRVYRLSLGTTDIISTHMTHIIETEEKKAFVEGDKKTEETTKAE
ncbi:MAG TPA: hypothetical protein PK295_01295 [Candidatus Magasanikbacteria bacterium]|nr:hypothetical protein [Candidatus Magasanikbacteria bacterium]